MSTTVCGIVEGGRVIPSSTLPEGARVEIRLMDHSLDFDEETRLEFQAWDRASDKSLELVEQWVAGVEPEGRSPRRGLGPGGSTAGGFALRARHQPPKQANRIP